jgi:2-methylisocitrate lyase-like PEP mutase family enzyme
LLAPGGIGMLRPMPTQLEKAQALRALHERPGAFLIPNTWDPGTARLLERLGFEALATTSAGYAFSIGKRDNRVGRQRMMEHLSAMAAAVDVPVSADLENGYGDRPEEVADAFREAATRGIVAASVEDSTGREDTPLYERALAVDRVRAAVSAARAMEIPFMVTARAENFLVGRADLEDTIARLQSYQEAGADVLYAPGVTGKQDLATLVRAVDRPVNVLMSSGGPRHTLAELAEIGVKRVSVGGALTRVALGAFLSAAREMKERGTFQELTEAAPWDELSAMFGP